MFKPRFPNHVFKSDVLNQTIGTFSSVNDSFTSPRSISRKRKSIFDGCEESFSKKSRPNQEKFITLDIQAAAQPQPQSEQLSSQRLQAQSLQMAQLTARQRERRREQRMGGEADSSRSSWTMVVPASTTGCTDGRLGAFAVCSAAARWSLRSLQLGLMARAMACGGAVWWR